MIQGSAQVKASSDPAPVETAVTTTDPNTGAVTVTPKPEAQRPSWLPEKFKSPEELAKAYGELEKKQSKPADPAPATQTAEQVRAAAEAAGIDINALNTEYRQKGALGEDTLKALEAKGIKRENVATYIEGQKAIAKQFGDALAAEVGGEQNYTNMIDWAKANMTAAEISAFDSAIGSGNPALAKMVVRSVNAKYAEAVGTDPSLVTGDGVPRSTGAQPFADSQEVVNAMADKRYKTSSTYRKEVADRLAVSDLFA